MAGEYSAPGVYRKEIDLSDVIVSQGISNGGTVVRAIKGPVRRPVLVTNNKEYIEYFGEPYYKKGLDDKNAYQSKYGGSLIPELGYGSYGALEFLKESSTLFVVRGYDDDDKYSTVQVSSSATTYPITDNGIPVSTSPLDVFDTSERISTYEEFHSESKIEGNMLVGFIGPGEDGNNYAVTIETISPDADWLYSYDEYPVETSATQAKYGFDVPEVWIDSSVPVWTTSMTEIEATQTIGGTSATYVLQPTNVVEPNPDPSKLWTIYSSELDSLTVEPAYNKYIDNWYYDLDTSTNTWTLSATYDDGVINGPISYTGSVTSATNVFHGGPEEVKKHFPLASDVVKISVYKKPILEKEWEDYYSNKQDELDEKLRFEPLEVFYGSTIPMLDADKHEMFIERTVNGQSKNIYVKSDKRFGSDTIAPSVTWDFQTGYKDISLHLPQSVDDTGSYVLNTDVLMKLSGGTVSMVPGLWGADSDKWDMFKNTDEINVNILINSSFSPEDKNAVSDVCNTRKDCIASNQVGHVKMLNYEDIINDENYGYATPSFMALYAGYCKVYDNYNDKYVYLPLSIFGAKLFARTDRVSAPWYAPAGTTRGNLSILDMNKTFSKEQSGKLYDKNINTARLLPSGFTMMGQKTSQMKKTALDRINVRRTIIYIENNIETLLNQFIFENNTDSTRLRVYSILDTFLAGIVASEGLYSQTVVCDGTNNPPSVIDANQLNVDIYVQPTKAIEYIQFTTVITKTGVSVSDVKLKYA